MPHPDFELYDNTGRTTEQIHGHNTGTPTTDDLHRWGATAAEALTGTADLPSAGASIEHWTELMSRATTPGQVHGIASAVIYHDDGAVARLHQFLESTATWYDEHGDQTSRRHYQGLADQFDALAEEMVQLTEDRARAAYHHTTAGAPATRPEPPPPAPPVPPGAGRPRR
nr:hypothetical protein OH826_19845 [Streptomyces sp. NBC_00899]